MDTKTDNKIGLFAVDYRISTGTPGAPELHLSLSVNTPNRTVSGFGQVTQAVLHPDVASAQMTGSYHEIGDVNGPNYVVSLDGYSPVIIDNDTRPVIEAELTMVGGWDSGTCNFSYRKAVNGPMTHVTDAKVRRVT